MSYTPDGLTTLDLQRELAAELRELFAETRLATTRGAQKAPDVYLQNLPLPQDDYDAEESALPFIIVRAVSGEIPDVASNSAKEQVSMDLYLGVYNNAPDNSGHMELLEMIQRIKNHFGRTQRVRNFRLLSPMRWVLDDANAYPNFFGAITMTFSAPRTIKEDPFV